uniref:Putative ionotropic receptor ligand binding domain-containing protein n=1 Tax=Phlebotomus papatasi TaxID=29031 RepID=A0A3F2ZEM3_PHLPP
MKSYKYLIIILAIYYKVKTCSTSDNKYNFTIPKFENSLSKLLEFIIVDFYSIHSRQITITRAASNHENYIDQSGIINEVLYHVEDQIPVRLEGYEAHVPVFTRFYNVFIVDSYESFRKIIDGVSKESFDFTGYYTVVLTNIERNYTDVVGKILHDCWNMYIINVNIVTYDPYNAKRAYMLTYFPYSPTHCGQVKPVITGVFEQETFRKNLTIFPEKVNNFHGCNLTVGTFQFEPYMIIIPLGHDRYHFSGFEGILTSVMSQRLNFSLILKTSDERWGKVEGDNSTGMSRMLLRGETNFSLGSFAASFSHYGYFSSSIPYHATPLALLIPPGRAHSNMEKLFLPMRYIIWSFLSAIFIISAIVVAIAKFIKPRRRAFIFGQRNNYPYINTINVFLGGSVAETPGRNFARFLLMLWILLSIVVRSSYQGALFGFLKEQKNVTIVDTFPKMLQEGYRIYGVEGTRKYFASMTEYKSMFVVASAQEVDELREKTANVDFKAAVVTPALIAAYMNEKHIKDNIRYRISKERIIQLYICIYMRKYSYLKEPFDKELWKYMESGLIHRWSSIYYNYKFLKEPPVRKIPKPLCLDQLTGIFMAFVILIGFSFFIFLLEVFSQKSGCVRKFCNFVN